MKSLVARRTVLLLLLGTLLSFSHRAFAQKTGPSSRTINPSRTEFRFPITASDIVTVQWRPVSHPPQQLPSPQHPTQLVESQPVLTGQKELPAPATSATQNPAPQPQPATQHEVDSEFLNKLLSALQDVLLTRLEGRVSLEKVTLDQGKIRLEGVLLRDAKIGLRLKNDAARRFAHTLLERYGSAAGAPPWTKTLRVASLGIYNDLEIELTLHELGVRRLTVDADALYVEGLGLEAYSGSGEESTLPQDKAAASGDVLQSLFQVLRRAAISRAEAHLRLDNLAAKRLQLDLEGTNLEGLSIAVALRRSDFASAD
jgi:hypothetical protein